MNRRDFVQAAGGALALAPLLGCASGADEGSSFSVWSWVHGDRDRDEGEWRRRFARLRKSGVEAVLVGGGDIELVSSAARAEGLEYHRWFWTMNRNGDAWARANHPEWFTVSRSLQSSLEHPPYV
ncbi:MAG: hypothetical protein OXI50_09260, partial [Gammaproteobacteria bacterium]|nr:hypothetical protein [Gammaproteobacteria bacterium]